VPYPRTFFDHVFGASGPSIFSSHRRLASSFIFNINPYLFASGAQEREEKSLREGGVVILEA